MAVKEEEKPKVTTTQDFVAEYDKLCRKMGFRVVANPVWIPRDDGSFSLVIRYSVEKINDRIQMEKN